MNAPFKWVLPLIAENLNEHSSLNEHPPQKRKGVLIWKFAKFVEVFIQIVCKNDETRVFFSQIFFAFYNKEIYKHILQWFLN